MIPRHENFLRLLTVELMIVVFNNPFSLADVGVQLHNVIHYAAKTPYVSMSVLRPKTFRFFVCFSSVKYTLHQLHQLKTKNVVK